MNEEDIELTHLIQKHAPRYQWVNYLNEETGEITVRRERIEPGSRDMDGNWVPTKRNKKPVAPPVKDTAYLLDESREDLAADRPNRMNLVDFEDGIFGVLPAPVTRVWNDNDDDIIDPH